MKRVVTAVCAIVFALSARAAEENPIDLKLDACIENDPSTAGMIDCIGDAYAAWDRELNDAYKALMKRLPTPQEKESLKNAQRQWVVWRDAEFAMLDLLYGEFEGTMYRPMRVDDRMQIVKARALILRGYEELLKSDE